jgi:hypothetical protein
MGIRIKAAWFHMPACINAVNLSAVQSETGQGKPTQYELEWMPQGLLVRVRNTKKAYIVGHGNVRSAELYDEGELGEGKRRGRPPAESPAPDAVVA